MREACEANGSRIAWIKTNGDVDLLSDINITNDNLTIWNDSYDFTVSGNGLFIDANNVIIRGLRIWTGENAINPDTNNCIIVNANNKRIVIDHCSLMISTDQNLALNGDLITVSNSIIAYALSNSVHSEGEHSKGVLIDDGWRITLYNNLFAHNLSRNPLLNQGVLEMVNNVVYNTGGTPVSLIPVTNNIVAYLIGNRFIAGIDNINTFDWFVRHVTSNFNVTGYLKNNITPTRTENDDETLASHPTNRSSFVSYSGNSPNNISEKTANETLLDIQSGMIGPPILNAIELQVIQDTIDITGSVIDHPTEAGFNVKYDA